MNKEYIKEILPKYLKGCVEITQTSPEYAFIKGNVKCECGNKDFFTLFTGKTIDIDGKPYPYSIEKENGFFFIIKAKCTACKREHLLFDQDYHGWDGYRCNFPGLGSLPRPTLETWICISCGSKSHRIQLRIDPPDLKEYKEYLEGKNEPFDEEKWALSFEWITMTITCCGCGLVTENWVDYETA